MKNNIMKRMAVCLLAGFMCLTAPLHTLSVYASDSVETFQIYIYSDTAEMEVGDFLIKNDEVYISEWTMKDFLGEQWIMPPEGEAIVFRREKVPTYISDDRRNVSLTEEDIYVSYTEDEVVVIDDVIYVPFVETMNDLYLNCSMATDPYVLFVSGSPNLETLVLELPEILHKDLYQMSYWQNSFTFGITLEHAYALDILKNFKYAEYFSGSARQNQYKAAFLEILFPQDESDIKWMKTINSAADKADDLVELLKTAADLNSSSYTGMLGDVIKFADYTDTFFDLTETASAAYLYTDSLGIRQSEKNVIRGVEYILNDVKDQDANVVIGGRDALLTYDANGSFLDVLMTDMANNVTPYTEQQLWKLYPDKKIFDLASQAMNLALGTQEQVDIVIKTTTLLEIQKLCKNSFKEASNEWGEGNLIEKGKSLQKMHDIVWTYLKAGMQAYRNLAEKNEFKEDAIYAVEHIQTLMKDLQECTENDIALARNVQDAHDILVTLGGNTVEEIIVEETETVVQETESIKETEAPETQAPEISSSTAGSGPIDFLVAWDPRYDENDPNSFYFDVDLYMYGTMDDGRTVDYVYTEETGYRYMAGDEVIAIVDGDELGAGKMISILNPNGRFVVEVAGSADWEMSGMATLNDLLYWMEVRIPGQEPVNIMTDTYYGKAPTGVWYYTFVIDHGTVTTAW